MSKNVQLNYFNGTSYDILYSQPQYNFYIGHYSGTGITLGPSNVIDISTNLNNIRLFIIIRDTYQDIMIAGKAGGNGSVGFHKVTVTSTSFNLLDVLVTPSVLFSDGGNIKLMYIGTAFSIKNGASVERDAINTFNENGKNYWFIAMGETKE